MVKPDIRRVPPFFDASKIGASLQEVDVQFIPTEKKNVISRWFHGANDADLFIWTDESDHIIKQQVGFCGLVVEWNLVEGLRTGLIVEQETGVPSMAASETIQYDISIEKSAVNMAVDLVRNVTVLKEDFRKEILDRMLNPHTMQSLTPDEFLKRYGPPLERNVLGGPSFLEALRSFFKKLLK